MKKLVLSCPSSLVERYIKELEVEKDQLELCKQYWESPFSSVLKELVTNKSMDDVWTKLTTRRERNLSDENFLTFQNGGSNDFYLSFVENLVTAYTLSSNLVSKQTAAEISKYESILRSCKSLEQGLRKLGKDHYLNHSIFSYCDEEMKSNIYNCHKLKMDVQLDDEVINLLHELDHQFYPHRYLFSLEKELSNLIKNFEKRPKFVKEKTYAGISTDVNIYIKLFGIVFLYYFNKKQSRELMIVLEVILKIPKHQLPSQSKVLSILSEFPQKPSLDELNRMKHKYFEKIQGLP